MVESPPVQSLYAYEQGLYHTYYVKYPYEGRPHFLTMDVGRAIHGTLRVWKVPYIPIIVVISRNRKQIAPKPLTSPSGSQLLP